MSYPGGGNDPPVGRGGRGEMMRRAMEKLGRRPETQHELLPPTQIPVVPDHPAALSGGGGDGPPSAPTPSLAGSQSARLQALLLKHKRAQMAARGQLTDPGGATAATPAAPSIAGSSTASVAGSQQQPVSSGRGRAMAQLLQSYKQKSMTPTGGQSVTAQPQQQPRAPAQNRHCAATSNGHGAATSNGHGGATNNGHGPATSNGHGAATSNGHGPATSNGHGADASNGGPVGELTSRMDRMLVDLEKPPVVRRGTMGRTAAMYTNHIGLRMQPGCAVHEYELRYTPYQDSMGVRFKLLRHERVRQVIGPASVHDGGKYYLPTKLPEEVTAITVPHPREEAESILVEFIYKKVIPLECCMHLLNICMKRIMAKLEMTELKRSYFDSKSAFPIAQHKMEVWPGYITAIHCYEGGIKLNVDVAHRVLHLRTALDVLVEAFNVRPNEWKNVLFKELVGSVVMTRYNKKTYRVDDIEYDSTPLSTFQLANGEMITYKEYYKKNYMLDIKQDEQPLLISRSKRKGALGKEVDMKICLIPELCSLTGLSDSQRADHRLMKSVIAMTAVKPEDRVRKLESFIRRIKGCPEAAAILNEWGLSLADHPSQLEGRALNPERLVFGGGKEVQPDTRDFSWDRAVKSNKVLTAVDLHNWVLVYLNRNQNVASQFVDCLLQCAPTLGIQVARPTMVELSNERTETFVSEMRKRINPQVQLMVTLMPSQREDRYAAVKRLCYIEKPVASQVVNFRTLNKDFGKLRPIVFKIAMQINCKLGGELWACKSPLKGTMVCGVDVFHDSPRAAKNSVLAMVSALNSDQTRFYSQARMHKAGQELGSTLSTCLLESVRQWHQANNVLPQNIVIFRDGVGDGQLRQTLELEVPQFESVFPTFGADYQPNLYVIVVQKRINTRIFSKQGQSGIGNAPPGTVVDHSVTSRNQYDFYLVSQHVNQGTVTPTHYVVVRDAGHWKPDYLQRLAYQSCHLYYNWCGTVRVPAPVQYAHRLAYMIGQVLHECPNDKMSSHLFYL